MAEGFALPDLVARLKVDTSGFKVGLETAGLAVTALAGAVIAFGIAAVEKTVDAGQAAYQMSEKFGMAGNEASAWLTVARHLGMSSESVGTAFKFLSKNLENVNLAMEAHSVDARKVMEETEKLKLAQDHYNQTLKAFGPHSDKTIAALLALQHQQDAYNKLTGEASLNMGPLTQAMKDLGLNIWDTHGKMKSANELMLESADIFAAMPDGIEKSGLAIKLFGKQGMDMLPMLNLGRKGLQDLMIQGQATGEVMSIDQVNAAHKLFLAQQKLNSEITGFTIQVGTALMPVLLSLIDYLTGTAVPGLVAFAKPWIAQLTPAITSFYNWLVALKPELQRAYDVISTLAPYIAGVATVWALWNVGLAATKAIGMIVFLQEFVAQMLIANGVVNLATAAQALWNVAMEANPIGIVVIAIGALVAVLIYAYTHNERFRNIVNQVGAAIKLAAGILWTDMKPALDWLLDKLKALWDIAGKVAGAVGGVFSAVGTFVGGTNSPTHRAGGGMVVPGGIYTVGERGPETLVMGSSGGRVIPNGGGSGATVNLTYHITGVGADIVANVKTITDQSFRDLRAMLRNGQLEIPG